MVLKYTLKSGRRMDSSGSEWKQEAECFEHGNEQSISIKCGEFD